MFSIWRNSFLITIAILLAGCTTGGSPERIAARNAQDLSAEGISKAFTVALNYCAQTNIDYKSAEQIVFDAGFIDESPAASNRYSYGPFTSRDPDRRAVFIISSKGLILPPACFIYKTPAGDIDELMSEMQSWATSRGFVLKRKYKGFGEFYIGDKKIPVKFTKYGQRRAKTMLIQFGY